MTHTWEIKPFADIVREWDKQPQGRLYPGMIAAGRKNLVSVIMPALNEEEDISAAIDSVFRGVFGL